MNPFARHGIGHLSASSLALYRNEPALWCLKYLHRVKDEAGPAAKRGTAVEAGVDALAYGFDEAQAIQTALDNFAVNTAGEASDEIEKERAAIPHMMRQAFALLKPLGTPEARQVKIEFWLDRIEVPLIGYVDYVYDGALVDLKTTHALPSKPRPDHVAQVALYACARNEKPALLYATTKKAVIYRDEIDLNEGIRVIQRSARALRAMLSRCEDKHQASAMFAPDFERFYWNDQTKAAAMEVYG